MFKIKLISNNYEGRYDKLWINDGLPNRVFKLNYLGVRRIYSLLQYNGVNFYKVRTLTIGELSECLKGRWKFVEAPEEYKNL